MGGSNSEVVTRMFGYFLTWMQDKTSSVYVIATANNANNLPPELKRKGRFDEIFCVNLPNEEERKAIFAVHLKKKEKIAGDRISIPDEKGIEDIAKATDGFNGADIESVVDETVEKAYRDLLKETDSEKKKVMTITISALKDQSSKTMSISKSCKTQIEDMKKVFKESNFTNASK